MSIYRRIISVGEVFEVFDSDDHKKEHPEYWVCTEIDFVDGNYLYFGYKAMDNFTGLCFVINIGENKNIPFKFRPRNRTESTIKIKMKEGRMKKVCTLTPAEFLELKKFFELSE